MNSKSNKKAVNNSILFCKECGKKLELKSLSIRKINNGRLEIYEYTYKCRTCKKKQIIKKIKSRNIEKWL
jgi:hypothetical protein